MKELEDNQLMKKVQNGDLSQMGILFDRHHKALFGFFYKMTNDAAQSEDMIQTVFYRLLKYRSTYRNEGKFVYWMYAVARNVLNRSFRKNDPIRNANELTALEESYTDEKTVAEEIDRKENTTYLNDALQKLVPEQKEAIILSKIEGLKYREIAKMTNVTENAIKARIRRGMLELKHIMSTSESN